MSTRSVSELELARLRAMTAEEKLAVSQALWTEAWNLKEASLRSMHPNWSTAQIEDAIRRVLSGGV